MATVSASSDNIKKLWISYLLALPPQGLFGAHNYYLGRRRMGIIFTCTIGILTFGWIIDLARMRCLVRRANEHIRTNKTDPLYLDDAYLAWFPLGLLGLHRFYLGDWIIGIVFVITLSAFTFGWWFDACFMKILVNASQSERNRVVEATNQLPEQNEAFEGDDNSPPPYSSIFGMMAQRLNYLTRSTDNTQLDDTAPEQSSDMDNVLPSYEAIISGTVGDGKIPEDPPPDYSEHPENPENQTHTMQNSSYVAETYLPHISGTEFHSGYLQDGDSESESGQSTNPSTSRYNAVHELDVVTHM